jgi:hypothetical protein
MAKADTDWAAVYDALAAEPNSFVRALASARRPNSAPDHDSEEHLKRVRANSPDLVKSMLAATTMLVENPRRFG